MEALSFIKFWRPAGSKYRQPSAAALHNVEEEEEEEELVGDGDDSFFELELSLSLSYFDNKENNNKGTKNIETEQNRADDKKATEKQSVLLPPTDHFSKKKVIPVETNPKPQSPISLLKPGPKFLAFSFKKATKPTEALPPPSPVQENKGSKSLNVRFKIDDDTARESSFRKMPSHHPEKTRSSIDETGSESSYSSSSFSSSSSSSKRFFNLIRPLYTKAAKKQSNKESTLASPASSPAAAAVMGKEKQRNSSNMRKPFGKSRSASAAAAAAASPVNRVDELVKQDGIQSAILHCKRSFHGSRESSMLSRSTSDSSSQEKLSTSSWEDSYAFSRIASDSSCHKIRES